VTATLRCALAPASTGTKQAMDATIKIVTASMEQCVLIMPDMALLDL
jgi:hypothetical protein